MHKYFKKQAFTLAEVLIVLAILGVIAAITVPSFYTRVNPNEKQCQIGLEKTKIAIDTALKQIIADAPGHSMKGLFSDSNYQGLLDHMGKSMQFTKKCTSANYAQCLGSASPTFTCEIEGSSGTTSSSVASRPIGITVDGAMIVPYFISKNCNSGGYYSVSVFGEKAKTISNICGLFNVDINGEKGPNKCGYDRFRIVFGKYGIRGN